MTKSLQPYQTRNPEGSLTRILTGIRSIAICTILLFLLFKASAQTGSSSWVRVGTDGRLQYTPDTKGNTIPDFSMVGYKSGDQAIPSVAVVKTLTAVSGDNLSQIQAAINEVSARALDANGFRGAILLKAGQYNVSNTLNITASGVVLRGEGNTTTGTRIHATRTAQHTVINILGSGAPAETAGTRTSITNSYVPVGAKSFNVSSASGYAVGDNIMLRIEPKQAWIDVIGTASFGWTPSSYNMSYIRVITKIEGNKIFVNAPVVDPIDVNLKNGFIYKYTWSRIQNVGVENIRFSSVFSGTEDENHAWTAISIDRAQHCWVRNSNFYHFGYSAVHVKDWGVNVSVLNCQNLEPISVTTGGRKYSFNLNGQLALFKDCYTNGGRHDYVTGSTTAGPSAFVKCKADGMRADIGPHHRWATGLLFDNVIGNGEQNVQNRGPSGSGHGWAGAQCLFWNCTSSRFRNQKPPQHLNWAIGCKGIVTSDGNWVDGNPGIWESTGNFIAGIQVLYDKQLQDRLNSSPNVGPTASVTSPANGATFSAPANITINASASDSDGSVTKVEFFQGATKLGEDLTSPYSFTWTNVAAGSYSLTAKATDNDGAVGTSSAISITVTSGPPACVAAAASADDGNVATNVLDGDLLTRWSASGDPQWIQFCLDATTAKTINGVKIAFYAGDARQSKFDILTSLDGVSWSNALLNQLSSGTSLNFETFPFSNRSARFVRIVGHGNTVNLWNSYTEVEIQIVIPNTPPSVSISSPSNGANFTEPANITINASASDADGSVSQVAFYNGSTLLGTDVTSPYSFTWSGVADGTYSLTARATDNSGATTTSSAVSVTVNPAPVGLPAPWSNADIGAVGAAGSATHSSGTFTVNGSGADIWGTADEFHYVYQPASGDVELIARVSSVSNTHAWAKAGLMVRETLAAGSINAAVFVSSASGVTFQRRTATSGTSVSTVVAGVTAPIYLKLTRSGNNFTASYSTTGTTWTAIGTEAVTMTASTQVGLAVTSHTDGTVATAPFTNVSVTGPVAPCPAVIDSGNDGNVAANVLDNDLLTRWSSSGDGQWIQFCLPTVSSVSGVRIAFYKGNERASTFDVLVSLDGTTFSPASMGRVSSGTSLALETFNFTPVNAKHIRIVGHGNNLNLWNSYAEVEIIAGAATLLSAEQASSGKVLHSYPVPAKGTITIAYEVKKAGRVKLSVYNTSNYNTSMLVDEEKNAGRHELSFDTRDLPAGLHIIKLVADGKLTVEKLLKQ